MYYFKTVLLCVLLRHKRMLLANGLSPEFLRISTVLYPVINTDRDGEMVILIIENDIKDRFNIEDSFNIHLPELKVITGAYSNCLQICINSKP